MGFVKKVDTGAGDSVKFTKIGDSVEGAYLGGTESEGKFGLTVKHMLKTKEGLKTVFAKPGSQLSSLLKGEEGNTIRITFEDEKRTGKGNPMKVYGVEVDNSKPRLSSEYLVSGDSEYAADTDEAEEAAPAARSPAAAREDIRARLNARRK